MDTKTQLLKQLIREQVAKVLREYRPGEGYTEIPKLINDIKTYLKSKKFTVEDHGEIQGDNFQPMWKKVDAQYRSGNGNHAGIAIDEGNVQINVVIGIKGFGTEVVNLTGQISRDIKQMVDKSGTGMKVESFGMSAPFSSGLSAIVIEMP